MAVCIKWHGQRRRPPSRVVDRAEVGCGRRPEAGVGEGATVNAGVAGKARLAIDSGRTDPVAGRAHPICPYLSLKSRSSGSQGVARDFFVDVDRLCVLTQVVQAGEASHAMTLKRPLTSVLAAGSQECRDGGEWAGRRTVYGGRDVRCV